MTFFQVNLSHDLMPPFVVYEGPAKERRKHQRRKLNAGVTLRHNMRRTTTESLTYSGCNVKQIKLPTRCFSHKLEEQTRV